MSVRHHRNAPRAEQVPVPVLGSTAELNKTVLLTVESVTV